MQYDTPASFDKTIFSVPYGEYRDIEYVSHITGRKRPAKVFLPPDYDEKEAYPLLVLLHGIGGDENEWLLGNVNEIISNLISQEKASKMIIVMPNQKVRLPSEEEPEFLSLELFEMFNRMREELHSSLIPCIEQRFSVKQGRENRAIAGLSMGGRNALYIGLSDVDKFAYIGAFEPAIGVLPYEVEHGLLTKETMTVSNEYKDETFLFLQNGKYDDVVDGAPLLYTETLSDNKVEHEFYEFPSGHDWDAWKNGLYHFAQRIF